MAGVMQTAYPYVCVSSWLIVSQEKQKKQVRSSDGLQTVAYLESKVISIRSDDRSHIMYPNLLILQMRKLKSSEAK